jgi:AcrR family transcriptional regulator
MSGGGSPEPERDARRSYDSPLRRAQVAARRERILEAACAIVHEFKSWDWRQLTFRAVAERAGVGERTVYRHFATEQALHEAITQRLGQESGATYEDLTIGGLAGIGANVFATMSDFAAPPWAEHQDDVLGTEDSRRRAALLAAVDAAASGWSSEKRTLVAAGLDVLWSVPSYHRLVIGWDLGADEATGVIGWMVSLVVDAISQDRGPDQPLSSRPHGTRNS